MVTANVWEEEVSLYDLPHVFCVPQFVQVLMQNKQHLVVGLSVVILDGDAVLEMCRVRLHSIINYDYIF